jgi:RsiW-degrading membrane proteinase PrsW (M82 family)
MPSIKKTFLIFLCGTLTLLPNLAEAMNLVKYDKNVVEVFNDASLVLLSLAGRLVFLMLVLGGVYYVMSGADSKKQETAKKIIKSALLGLILVMISYAFIVALDKIGVKQ